MLVEVNGTRLWFEVEDTSGTSDRGREPLTVLLLHGGPGGFDHTYLRSDFGRLGECARVVYLDLRAHGRSARGDEAAWTYERCADDLAAVCDALRIERPIVYGHSMGSFIAQVFATRHPGRPRALILDGTMARFDLRRIVEGVRARAGDEVAEIARRDYAGEPVSAEEWARVWRAFGPWVPGAPERARVIANPAVNGPGMACMRRFDQREALATVRCPVLVLAGSLDPVTPVAAARDVADALPAGRGRLEVLDGAGHFPWRDRPDRYWEVVLEFLEQLGPDAPTR